MENLHFVKEQPVKGIYASALSPTRKLEQVSVLDIGADRSSRPRGLRSHHRQRFDLAGDELTGNDAMSIHASFILIVSRDDWSRLPGSAAPHRIADKANLAVSSSGGFSVGEGAPLPRPRIRVVH
jgi:hypothetical protein